MIGQENLDRNIYISDFIHNGAWVFTDIVRQNLLAVGVDLTNLPILMGPTVYPGLAAKNLKLLREARATLDKIHEYSIRLKGHMFNSQEDLRVRSIFRVRHRKVKQVVPKECFWEPPENNELMLYCDGAAQGNPGRAGAGVVVHDDNANVVGAMSVGFGVQTNYLDELFCVIVGLEWATKFEIGNICVRTDSMTAVSIYTRDNNAVPWLLLS
ncbi:uncharacterized protein LOC113279483 [Papaver somniferum]|uniref:uncharacterized protein LOC113279483 n=1 Tax=Papaver somniferum TaxID=3469 RepID=UPI000E6FF791|nr:uncharacterized protein LOC113279483 [Papaver somniferum]